MALWLVAAVMFVGLAVLVASLASPQTGELVMSRILGQSTSIDMGEASSGRTTLWAAVIARMMSEPITLLTGYGWDTYQTFPFRYVPHNFYLNLWFNLGLPGVLSFLTILLSSARTAAKAAERVVQPMRMYLCAFTIGMLSLVVTIFFTDLFIPWLYIWVYVGASMRAAVIANSAEEAERAALPATPLTTGGSQRWRGPVVAGRWPATSRR
jgi:O-antigen ligase